MKRLFIVIAVLYTASDALAGFALHIVFSKSSYSDEYPIRVNASDSRPESVDVFIPVEKASDPKGYFLVTATERQPADALNFRKPMINWASTRYHPEGFELIRPLEAHESEAGTGIFINLEKETALRSYIVYDFKPWGGALIMDGGLWITYDLPSFVDELSKASNTCPWYVRLFGRCRFPDR